MTYEERIKQSETHTFKVVFPDTTNHHNTMFGGTIMKIMDEVAFITATRFSRKTIVTVSCDQIDFKTHSCRYFSRACREGKICRKYQLKSKCGGFYRRKCMPIQEKKLYLVISLSLL